MRFPLLLQSHPHKQASIRKPEGDAKSRADTVKWTPAGINVLRLSLQETRHHKTSQITVRPSTCSCDEKYYIQTSSYLTSCGDDRCLETHLW
eukprot:3785457-Amphidinium_carterae.2